MGAADRLAGRRYAAVAMAQHPRRDLDAEAEAVAWGVPGAKWRYRCPRCGFETIDPAAAHAHTAGSPGGGAGCGPINPERLQPAETRARRR